MQTLTVDVLICGGGMSGMACAAFAADAGAKVLVVEKQSVVGGSSNYSAGMFWAPKSYERLRSWVPAGDPELQAAWMKDYLPAVQWIRENGIPIDQSFDGIMTIGIGFPIKIPRLHDHHQQRIKNSNTRSEVFTDTSVIKLIQQYPGLPGSRIIGAIIRQNHGDRKRPVHIEVKARQVVLATGGFQGNPSLTSTYIGQGGDSLFIRSNRGSVGDGLTLARAVGAGTSRGMNTYYGHLLPAPLRAEDVNPKDFLALAQYQSKHCLLINESGRRFTDETMGDEIVNQYLAKQEKRCGDKTRNQHCISAPFPNAGEIDRLEKARAHGCKVASAHSIDQLIEILETWGVDSAQARRTIEQYDRVVRLGDKTAMLDAPVGKGGKPPMPLTEGQGPFFAMEVQPSITFTYGGILIDAEARALTADKTPIPGLLVTGVDGGGFSNVGYAGGLALAFVTGLWAARTVAKELGLPAPQLPAADPRDVISSKQGVLSRV
ncbi:uncharacterized protein CDV56_108904 [Aspergillus thermomutatus]|uniref:FAD-dependent oxidoreductase 2 FAD-binding domain-containing protein n=1 Tax=Aspergillus thermomutatus TaxID=41047 RepID=A0A397HN01_ASPTH|nr:uncharacterized protein CDV56_108904 [Aspergillus thermomutatus]RHZ61830.1 hypothetical protein CDV56_108904 [Aspergillus thermomutatus]